MNRFYPSDRLESIQCHSARFVCKDYRCTSSVTSMMNDLGWKALKDRRREQWLDISWTTWWPSLLISFINCSSRPIRSSQSKQIKHLTFSKIHSFIVPHQRLELYFSVHCESLNLLHDYYSLHTLTQDKFTQIWEKFPVINRYSCGTVVLMVYIFCDHRATDITCL